MTDIKTVMSWIEGLTQDDWRLYYSDSEVQETAKAALALLKEQEPRVITPEEVKAYNGYCWFEKNNAAIMCVSLIKDGQIFDFSYPPYDMKLLNWFYYGKNWRCWSAKPTDEQRKAVKWD